MPNPRPTRQDDLRLLEILDYQDRQGHTLSKTAARFAMGRNTLAGLRNRTVAAAGKIPCTCEKPENRDGGMPERWWAA